MLWNQCTNCNAVFDRDDKVCPVKCVGAQIQQIELSVENVREIRERGKFYTKDQAWLASI